MEGMDMKLNDIILLAEAVGRKHNTCGQKLACSGEQGTLMTRTAVTIKAGSGVQAICGDCYDDMIKQHPSFVSWKKIDGREIPEDIEV